MSNTDQKGEHLRDKSGNQSPNKLVSWYESIRDKVGLLAALLTILAMITLVPDVILRVFFGTTITGVLEFNEVLIVAIVYLGMASNQASGSNVRVELFADKMPRKLQPWLLVLGTFVGLIVFICFAYYNTAETYTSIVEDEQKLGVSPFPVWPSRVLLSIGVWLLCAQLLLETVRRVTGIFKGEFKTVSK
jgi:TRAP-type mannitol/chloroaromatic compound transport system permease small subunit